MNAMKRNKAREGGGLDAPVLQYANLKTVHRTTIGNGRFTPLVGFHIEVGKNEEVDRAFHDLKVQVIEIKHQRPGGSEIIRHWFLGERIAIYPVTSGPVAKTMTACMSGKNRQLMIEAGLGVRWPKGEKSSLSMRVYLKKLTDVGVYVLFLMSVRSKMTDVLLGILDQHATICEALDTEEYKLLFPDFALPLGAGDEEDWGKGETTTVVPFKCLHPEPGKLTEKYIDAGWRSDQVAAEVVEHWPEVVTWAEIYSTVEDKPEAEHEEGE